MASDHPSDDFDWVSAQSKCSAAAMFERLRARVRQDVERRNGLLERNDGWRFEFDEEGNEFEVARVSSGNSRVAGIVRFERAGRRIHVLGEDVDVEFSVIVTLDVNGQCRFLVGEAMYSEWEIRRMALEPLFFEETDEESA